MGFVMISSALDLPLKKFSEMMALNLEAGLHLSQLAHPLMKANGKGSIVFNSSIAGSSVLGLQSSAYSMSKGKNWKALWLVCYFMLSLRLLNSLTYPE